MNRKNPIGAAAGMLAMVVILCALCLGEAILALVMSGKRLPTSAAVNERRVCVVIDAGHGGIDGGAVGIDGTVEKEVNLALAKRLYELLRFAGIDCVMTREDDRLLADESMKSHRKMHDLKNRVAVAQAAAEELSAENVLFVSIHMNNFPQSRYSGLQVWYSKNSPESQSLAARIQSYVKTFITPENDREIKKATSAIYILERLDCPAVLIECGFLSNPEECARLASAEYQCELAATLFAAITDAIG